MLPYITDKKYYLLVEMAFIYFLVLSSMLCLESSMAWNRDQTLKTDKCPENWLKVGTGCYLFAIPEILEIDHACTVAGNYNKILILKFNPK